MATNGQVSVRGRGQRGRAAGGGAPIRQCGHVDGADAIGWCVRVGSTGEPIERRLSSFAFVPFLFISCYFGAFSPSSNRAANRMACSRFYRRNFGGLLLHVNTE
jgi:hypothetical protein